MKSAPETAQGESGAAQAAAEAAQRGAADGGLAEEQAGAASAPPETEQAAEAVSDQAATPEENAQKQGGKTGRQYRRPRKRYNFSTRSR